LTSVHPTARHGFLDGDVYERGRPGYAEAAIASLGFTSDHLVLDLGCGTGKSTRQLAATGARVIGVEPLPSMLQTFVEKTPGVPVVAGQAEALGLRSGAVDAVVCASVFHWLDHKVALPEIHRVLRNDGRLVIMWNRRDRIAGWAADFWKITEAHRRGTPSYRTDEWRNAIEASRLFGPIEERRFDHVQTTDVDGLLARVASISFIETLRPPTRNAVIEESRRFIETHPDTRGRTTIDLPYETTVYVCERR
jgi:SAM-dependent methyltransferase